jgi:hypothetical protein
VNFLTSIKRKLAADKLIKIKTMSPGRKFIKNVAIISLTMSLMIAGTAWAQNKNPNAPWFFVQLTDPQFGMFDNNASFEKETVLYEKAVAEINILKPDFVVITGDLVHDPDSVQFH